MAGFDLAIYTLKFVIPSAFAILFRGFGLGYTTRHRFALGLAVFTAYMVIVPPMLITVMGYGQFTHIVSLVMTAGGMSALIFSSDPLGKTILLVLIVGQVNSVVSVPLNMVRHLLGLSYLTLDIMMLVASAIVFFIALRFLVKPLRFIADNIHGRLTAPMLIPIVTTAMIYAIPVYPARNFEFHPIYCTVMMLAVELVFFLYLYTLHRTLLQISELSEHKLDSELLRLSAISMAERLRLMDESAHLESLVAHDRRHFNSMMLELLEQGQTEEASAFLRQQAAVTPPTGTRFCDNAAVNAIVCCYAKLAKEAGITTDIALDIPNEIANDSLELAMAISNLLENAIHGCEGTPVGAVKTITLICRHVGRLALEIKNPCAKDTTLDKNGYPTSRQEGHGIGTKSIMAFVQKYDGELFYRIENGVFSVRMLV